MRLEDDHEVAARAVVLATGAEYRRLPVDDLDEYEGISVFYAAGPPEAQRCGAARVGWSAAATRPPRRRSGWRAAGRWSRCCTAAPTCARRCRTTSLIELERYGVAVRDRSEIAELHGSDGELEAVTLHRRRAAAVLVPVPVPRRRAVHRLAGRRRGARRQGLRAHRAAAGADGLLETSVPGVYAAGDVRSGSVKRCATAVGEGAMVVRFVHGRLAA